MWYFALGTGTPFCPLKIVLVPFLELGSSPVLSAQLMESTFLFPIKPPARNAQNAPTPTPVCFFLGIGLRSEVNFQPRVWVGPFVAPPPFPAIVPLWVGVWSSSHSCRQLSSLGYSRPTHPTSRSAVVFPLDPLPWASPTQLLLIPAGNCLSSLSLREGRSRSCGCH